MMHIEIAERLRPFSHLPGIFFVLPGTNYRLQVFPTCLKIEDLSGPFPIMKVQLNMNIQGPLKQFTVEQDLEKGWVRVWGISSAGLFRYHIKGIQDFPGVVFVIEKAPLQGVSFQCTGEWSFENPSPFQAGERRLIFQPGRRNIVTTQETLPIIARLSFGNHKSQDWELIRRRHNLMEIFPIWHRLGQLIPKQSVIGSSGTLSLLKDCQKAIIDAFPENILSHFEDLFLAGFEGGLSPRLYDLDFHGIVLNDDATENFSPLPLLSHGSNLIQSLFVQCHNDTIAVLPACPPLFHCGRFINVRCGQFGILSIEWTKKALRCMSFIAASSQTVSFTTHDGQRRCRIRQSYQDRGITYQLGSLFHVNEGQIYWFDNFMS